MDQSTDIYAKANAELVDIDRQFAALERRRAELRQFIELGRRLYGGRGLGMVAPLSIAAVAENTLASFEHSLPAIETVREGTMKARIIDLSRSAIQMHGPLPTTKLVELIEQAGQPITGKDKNVTVSVILSRSNEFVSDRSRGWSLAAEKTPADVAASPGSSAT